MFQPPGHEASGWIAPPPQEGTFTPEGPPNFIEVHWAYLPDDGTGVVDVMINGRSIYELLRNADLDALRLEAATHVEGRM